MKKRIITTCLALFLVFSLIPATTVAATPTIAIRVFLDGKLVTPAVAPYISEGRTLVPIRAVAETLGAEVAWDSDSKTVTITRAGTEIKLVINERYATVNDKLIELDVAPCITDNTTFLPLRFISEQLSQKVEWDSVAQAVMISEDMSFAHENANIKDWMLGCGAILAKVNERDPYSIGMNPRTISNAKMARQSLSGSWNCDSREELIETILSMTDGGHAEDFKYDAALVNSFTDSELNYLLENSSETDRFMWPLVKNLSAKWGERGIKAWDWFRMTHIAGWGYLAGYLDLSEVYTFVEPVAKRLLDTFSSWDEATENYMDGYAYWSRTDVSKPNTSYTQRIAIYETLKAEQKEKGLLFNPDVWSQPVIGIID